MSTQKVYTRTGDKGTTGLADGSRVPKTSLRIESYGTLDELNSVLGICRQIAKQDLNKDSLQSFETWLDALQNDLFNLGSDLATPKAGRWPNMIVIDEQDVASLEKLIDLCQAELPALREFVLPGGSHLNAYLHLARTVCRRAERKTVALQSNDEINPFAVTYLNRLSDLLFVLARWVQHKANQKEITWDKAKGVRTLGLS